MWTEFHCSQMEPLFVCVQAVACLDETQVNLVSTRSSCFQPESSTNLTGDPLPSVPVD